jgi:hypothetical protein
VLLAYILPLPCPCTVDCVTAVAGELAADDILMLGSILGDVVPNFAALLAVAFDPSITDVLAAVGIPAYS